MGAPATSVKLEDLKHSEGNQRSQVPSQTKLKFLPKVSQSVVPAIRKLVEVSDTTAKLVRLQITLSTVLTMLVSLNNLQ